MTTNKYITLADSVPVLSKRFRVVQSGYKPAKNKKQQIYETIGGGLDVSNGSIYESHQYVLRLREEEEDTDYGTTHDLDYFYSLNDPQPTAGSPGDLLTLTDHYGNIKYGYMVGDFIPEPVTTIIEGIYAWFLIPINLRILPD